MKTVLLGLDAFDPDLLESRWEKGQLKNLEQMAKAGSYSRLAISNPPQSEVSWTSMATGLNPGGHGMFDFVHRNPQNYNLVVSLLPTKQSRLGRQFVSPFEAPTLFDQAADDGYPATALWWPAFFPARPQSPVRTIPGLGTPDIHGRLGVGRLFTSAADVPASTGKTPISRLQPKGQARYEGQLPGPARLRQAGRQLRHRIQRATPGR